jgi:hypothetical protein
VRPRSRIYVGPHTGARDVTLLRTLGVTAVLSLSAETGKLHPSYVEYHWEAHMAEHATSTEQCAHRTRTAPTEQWDGRCSRRHSAANATRSGVAR